MKGALWGAGGGMLWPLADDVSFWCLWCKPLFSPMLLHVNSVRFFIHPVDKSGKGFNCSVGEIYLPSAFFILSCCEGVQCDEPVVLFLGPFCNETGLQ